MNHRNTTCALATLTIVLLSSGASVADDTSVLYVMRGEVIIGDDQLTITPRRVEWFTDRPAHDAGQISGTKFQDVWESGLATPPPNAALVGDGVNAIVELTSLSLDGTTMRFGYDILRGELSDAKLGETTLFIDGSFAAGTLD